ncbi:MAG TPA: agmatinase [Balneolaceae bacterium]|nr:agmatinase [Balneolaceae bacterium]
MKPILLRGIPFDQNSSWLKGAADAPGKIREVMFSGSSNMFTEGGTELISGVNIKDAGDLNISEKSEYPLKIKEDIQSFLAEYDKILVLGGDHSITYPLIQAFTELYNNLTILHFDAHSDLYDSLDGNRYSHACPFARIMEENKVKRLVQAGIRTLNDHQREQAEKFGVEIIDMKNRDKISELQFEGPVYLSLDLDVLDPGCAHGVSHHEPGGFQVRELLDYIQNLKLKLVGADIVEYNPQRDLHNMTAMVAVKFLKEIAGKLIGNGPE